MNTARDAKGRFAKGGNGKITLPGSDYFEREMALNAAVFSRSLMSRMLGGFDPRRNIDDEVGYPRPARLTIQEYREFYDRDPIAARVVGVMPDECWMTTPTVFEDEDVDNETEFEKAWDELGHRLLGTGWYKTEKGNPIWEYLHRADVLSGIGAFGVMLLGLDDGKPLGEPAEGINEQGEATSSRADRKLIYLRAFDESLVKVASLERDMSNPRYGQPTEYTIMLSNPNESVSAAKGLSTTEDTVHWSRVIHLADNLGSSEVFGTPRMQTVFNRLYDLRKLYAGSAEMYWRGAFPGLSFETHPQLGGDVPMSSTDQTAMREQIEKYMTGLQRYLAPRGMHVNSLAPQVVDPTPQIDTQIEAICVEITIPKRIFTGSERGQLASSQDTSYWNGVLTGRDNGYITPRMIVPFADRLIAVGVLPEPAQYMVVWPDLDTLTEQEQSEVALKRTEAMVKYVQGGVEALIVPQDYLERIHGMQADEALSVIEAAREEDEPMTLPEEDEAGDGQPGQTEED